MLSMREKRPTSVDCDGIVQPRLKMLGAGVALVSLLVSSVVLLRII